MARIEIDLDDYVDKISTEVLLDELKRRGKDIAAIHEFKTDTEKINYLKAIFGLREFHDKERLLEEIKQFLDIR
ncbi:MAG: hypothetical protein LBF69_05920 [Prevotellaceae bacterium]|jgi:hypothetical protein|nr:hypothetical protein [Prevotellaceae bacterium]